MHHSCNSSVRICELLVCQNTGSPTDARSGGSSNGCQHMCFESHVGTPTWRVAFLMCTITRVLGGQYCVLHWGSSQPTLLGLDLSIAAKTVVSTRLAQA